MKLGVEVKEVQVKITHLISLIKVILSLDHHPTTVVVFLSKLVYIHFKDVVTWNNDPSLIR